MFIEIKNISKNIRYTKISQYIYDNPFRVEVGVMALSTQKMVIGQEYDLIDRTGEVHRLAYVGVSTDAITEAQTTTQLVFCPKWFYRVINNEYRRGDTLFSLNFKQYIPFASQLNFLILQIRNRGLFFKRDGLQQITAHQSRQPIKITQPKTIKRAYNNDSLGYRNEKNELSKPRNGKFLAWYSDDDENLNTAALNQTIKTEWEIELSDTNLSIGDSVLFRGKKRLVIEVNSFHLFTKTIHIVTIGSLEKNA